MTTNDHIQEDVSTGAGMTETFVGRVHRLTSTRRADPGEVQELATTCAELAASYLTGYGVMQDAAKASEMARLFVRCDQWLDQRSLG